MKTFVLPTMEATKKGSGFFFLISISPNSLFLNNKKKSKYASIREFYKQDESWSPSRKPASNSVKGSTGVSHSSSGGGNSLGGGGGMNIGGTPLQSTFPFSSSSK